MGDIMRKFVISDIHGFGNVYYSMMKYLDNLSCEEDIELYINGDLIDRGYESAEILLDIKKRIEDNKYKITYLGGNHELMMYEVFEKRKKGIEVPDFNDWYNNGGYITDYELSERLNYDDNELDRIANFISNLKIYHKFEEKINNKNILLIHAAAPMKVLDECELRIKDNDLVYWNVWARENDPSIPFRCRIGNSSNFTIVGHTPNSNPLGYDYHKKGNYLNIDGGCAFYASGYFGYDHFPLVEICPGYLKILTFNSNNEIICANYFDGTSSFAYTTLEIEKARFYLDKNVKIKKLSINEDGICGYWN